MTMRRAMMTATILLACGTAQAAPSCRDGKGLFTPCTGERTPAVRRHRETAAPEKATDTAADAPTRAAPVHTRPPLVARTRSCRDGKGLYTPCPR